MTQIYGVVLESSDKAKIFLSISESSTLESAIATAKVSIHDDLLKQNTDDKKASVSDYVSGLRVFTYSNINVSPTPLPVENMKQSKKQMKNTLEFIRDNAGWTLEEEQEIINKIIKRMN